MKLTKVLFIGLIFFIFSGAAFGQEITYSAAEGLFNDSQKKVLEKAEKHIDKGDKKIKLAEKIEAKYTKKKKKKKKKKKTKASKFDKKTWEAKKFRIQAEKEYLKAYQDASTVYSEIIVAADFFDDGDHTEATALNNEAVKMVVDAEKKMSKYNKTIGNKKTLKKMPSAKLKTAIKEAHSLKENAINKQKEALDLVLNQGKKKEAVEKDNAAWANAQNINTIEAYKDYIDSFSSGKYVTNARAMIRQLKAEEEKKREVVIQASSDYTFKVQIAASKTQLSNYELQTKYPNTSEIEQVYTNYYYKYWVGSFGSYSQAVSLRDQLLMSTVPDAFIVVFDKSGNQIDVSFDMKN